MWLVCKHLSHLGMKLKHPVYKKSFTKSCLHLHKLIDLSAVVALEASLSRRENGSHYPVKSVVRSRSTREEQRLAKQKKRMTMFDHSLPLTNSFNVHFAILLTLFTLCCTWPTVPKACATPTNTNAHMSVQRLLSCARVTHCEYVHLVSVVFISEHNCGPGTRGHCA